MSTELYPDPENLGKTGNSELLANVASSDEQEALLRTIINAPESGDALHVAEAKRVRDAVLAAGFHRTPSAVEQVKVMPIEQVRAEIKRRRTVQGKPEAPNSESFGSMQGEPEGREAKIHGDLVTMRVEEWRRVTDELTRLRTEEAEREDAQGEPTDATLAIMAQAFYSATSGPGIGIHYDSMMVKPEIMEGIRVALRAAAIEGGHR